MIRVAELKHWLATLEDDDAVGIDDGGLLLETEDGEAYIEVGGIPEEGTQ